MSESSTKTSTKKGFTAPVLKDNLTNGIKHSESKESKVGHDKSRKPKQKEVLKTDNTDENRENYKISKKPKLKKKPETPLSDSQYEDIFSAVLSLQKSNSNSEQHNTEGTPRENTPSNGIQEASEKQQRRADTKTPPSSLKVPSQLSPWGSHFNKYPSQGLPILKEMQEWQSSLQLQSLVSSDSSSSSDERESSSKEVDKEGEELSQQQSCRQLSQVSGSGSQGRRKRVTMTTDQRSRLEELQRHRNVGVWVYCCRPSCQKQRYLSDITDPQDVPDVWYCHMNPDRKYNNCQCEEQQVSAEEEADMIYNQFTAGSLVWARVDGYPWWPAMVDDDPDLEQYYWLAEDFMNVTHYHVVFFDDLSVTRAWVNLKNIAAYTKHGSNYKQRIARGIDYSRRIKVAKEQADDAASLSTVQRLKIYSFIARFKGHIATSDSQAKKTMTKYKLKFKTPKEQEVHSQKEIRKKDVKENKKHKEEKKAKVKDVDETPHNSNNSIISKNDKKQQLGKRKKNDDEEEYNKKSKQPKSMFEKKSTAIMNQKKREEKLHSKSSMKSDGSDSKNGTESSSANENVKQIKKQKDKPNNLKENLIKSDVESLSYVRKKLTRLENSSEKEDFESQVNFKEKVIEETIVDETDNNQSKESSQISHSRTDKELEHDSRLTNAGEEDETNLEENKCTLTKQQESETPSGFETKLNLSQKSKSSDRRNLPGPSVQQTDDFICGLIQPSQESKHSQSTIADFFLRESEDAVVPDSEILSQLSSQPFEE